MGLLRECADEEKRGARLEGEAKEARAAGDSAAAQLQGENNLELCCFC